MVTPKPKEKLFRLSPEEDVQLNNLIQYAYKVGSIAKPTLQEFMRFTIQCTYNIFKQDWDERKNTPHRRRPVI